MIIRLCFQLVLSCILLLLSNLTYATTYYVDNNVGLDSNNGTSTTTPIKHVPGDSDYTPTGSAPTTLAPGDVVIFKGGVVYQKASGYIHLTFSGSDSSPIVYDGDSGVYAQQWGDGSKAIIDGMESATNIFRFWSANYIIINNFDLKNIRSDTSNAMVYEPYGNSDHVTISNCYIHDSGNAGWDNEGVWTAWVRGTCIDSFSDNWLIHGNTFEDCYSKGVYLHGSASNNTVSHNLFNGERISWAISVATSSGIITGNTISNNTFKNIGKDYKTTLSNPPHNNHFMSFIQGGPGQINNINIFNNYHYSDDTTDAAATGIYTLQINETDASSSDWNVYNNVAANCAGGAFLNISVNSGHMNNFNIENNSVWSLYNNAGLGFVKILDTSTGGTVNGLTIKNNIYSLSYLSMMLGYFSSNVSNWTNVVVNNNLGFTTFATDGWYAFGLRRTWAQWQGLGYDTNGININPSFNNISIPPYDLRTTSTINIGASSSLVTTDIVGVSRPQNQLWDIGAYEYPIHKNHGSPKAMLSRPPN